MLQKYNNEKSEEINIKDSAILKLVESLDKLQEIYIIEFTCDQITALVKGCGLHHHAAAIKKYSIDGFNLICSLSDWDTVKDIKNYFQGDEIKLFLEISYLFLAQYYRQFFAEQRRRASSQLEMKKKNTEAD